MSAAEFVIINRAHMLKVARTYFEAVRDGSKRAEIRKDDRGFGVGDVLILREWRPNEVVEYTGRFVVARVTHVLHGPHVVGGFDGLAHGYVSVSFRLFATDGKVTT